MIDDTVGPSDQPPHAFGFLRPREREGVVVYGRRSVLKSSLAGIGGLTVPALLKSRRSEAALADHDRSVILIWMTGGPSHIDTWDPKPDMPAEIRGPFRPISTRLPSVQICEFLPKQAAMLDRFTLIRSVDCRQSNHEPNMVMQTGSRLAAPRVNPRGHLYPALGSVVARHIGVQRRGMPAYVALNMQSRSHVAWGGSLGQAYDPLNGRTAAQVLGLSAGLSVERLADRRRLLADIDRLRAQFDGSEVLRSADCFTQQAFDIVLGGRGQKAFDLDQEPESVRALYGDHEWARQALLARRLVEHGSSFVTIDLSNHGASGTWDTHGDNIPPYGGIWNGLRPLLPVFDHVVTTLVADLETRGLIDRTLVVAMGEFGRTPRIGTQGSGDGRDHWPFVMSACLAGGGLRHGQVIGRSSRDGGEIAARPVTPADLAATILNHMRVPLDTTYLDHQGRPTYVIEEGGRPLDELF